MTLIATFINKYGITQLSDSNLSNAEGNAGFGQKVFPINHLNASLAYAGSYYINGERIDSWMNNFITGSFHSAKLTIEEFVKQLTDKISSEIRNSEIAAGTIIHIAGYQRLDSKSYAQHYHISNVQLLEDGRYSKPKPNFQYGKDLDTSILEDRMALLSYDLNSNTYGIFINGLFEARISVNLVRVVMDNAFEQIWGVNGIKFRKPTNIFESATLWKLYMEIICQLYKLSDYNALFVGGEIQSHLIPVPQDIDKDIGK